MASERAWPREDARTAHLHGQIAIDTEAIRLLLPLRHNQKLRSELRGFIYAVRSYRRELGE